MKEIVMNIHVTTLIYSKKWRDFFDIEGCDDAVSTFYSLTFGDNIRDKFH